MTLIITHVSQRRIFQSGDFRLTDARTGQQIDYWAQKQIIVQRSGWTALVGFCGIAHTGREYVPEWIVQQLRATPQDAAFEDFLLRLRSAEDWLARAIPRFRAITFSVGAFVDFKPVFVLMSNFEAIGRPPGPLPRTLPATLEVTRFRPRKEQLFLSGRPDAVLAEERRRLLGTFRKVPPLEAGYAALADLNRHASTRDGTVGPACFTAHVTVLGDQGGSVHEWPADREYLPAFVDVQGMILPRLRAVDEHGRPKPLQITGTSGAMFVPSAEYFRVALEEKPTDPSILSNYGNCLKDRGELDRAEEAYRKAIVSDDGFASAHGNLAILLDECGDVDAAEQEHRRAVELDSNSPIWAANLAFFLWRRRGERATGDTLLKEALGRRRDAFSLGAVRCSPIGRSVIRMRRGGSTRKRLASRPRIRGPTADLPTSCSAPASLTPPKNITSVRS
jgi:tetratricopeptide (TPR) repeat protein